MKPAFLNPWLWAAAHVVNLCVCLAWRAVDPAFAFGYAKYTVALPLLGLGVVLALDPRASMGRAATCGSGLVLAEVYLLVWLLGSRFNARLAEALPSVAMRQIAIGMLALLVALLAAFAVVIPFIVVRAERRRRGHAT